MNKETLEGFSNIESLVEKHFNLTKESMEVFKKHLYKPDFAEEYKRIYDEPDGRLFVEIDPLQFEDDDENWETFKNTFSSFIEKENITYENYLSGKKDGKKITTLFFSSIIENLSSFTELIHFILEEDSDLFRSFHRSYFMKNSDFIQDHGVEKIGEKEGKFFIKSSKKTFLKKFNPKEIVCVLKDLKSEISSLLNKNFFGVKRSSNSLVCFSVNFSDWLLASTGEEWSSCISLDSSCGYWQGLAGLVGDKNRVLIYITNKKEKEAYGIKSYKMIERSWGFLYKDFNGNKYFGTNKKYPNKEDSFDMKGFPTILPKEVTIIEDLESNESSLTSLYEFPTIFHNYFENDHRDRAESIDGGLFYSSSIYEDFHDKTINKFDKNKSYYVLDKDGNGSGVSCFSFSKTGVVEENGSLYRDCNISTIKDDLKNKRKNIW